MTPARIVEFWEWFASRSEQLEAWLTGESSKIAEEMQRRVPTLSKAIGWEIGPGAEDRCFLAFTLNGDLRNLDPIIEILQSAPRIPGWEFRAGRPQRNLAGPIAFHNSRGQRIEVSLEDWRYVLTAFDGGKFFDIEITTSRRLSADDRARQQILHTAVQAALGELDALKFVDRVEFIEDPDKDWSSRATPFRFLAEHLDSLKPSSPP